MFRLRFSRRKQKRDRIYFALAIRRTAHLPSLFLYRRAYPPERSLYLQKAFMETMKDPGISVGD